MRTAVFRDFKPIASFRSLFRRKSHKIIDANLHHGDIRPFACPEKLCCNTDNAQELYSLRECECLQFDFQVDATGGFCRDHHFFIKDGILRESTTEQMCLGESCLAGLPIPDYPTATASCTECDGKTPPVRKELYDATPIDIQSCKDRCPEQCDEGCESSCQESCERSCGVECDAEWDSVKEQKEQECEDQYRQECEDQCADESDPEQCVLDCLEAKKKICKEQFISECTSDCIQSCKTDCIEKCLDGCVEDCERRCENNDCGMEGEAYISPSEANFDCNEIELDPDSSIYEVSCSEKGCDAVEIFYRITWVKSTPSGDIESAPSEISNGVNTDGYIPEADISWGTPPDGWCIDRVRLYRSESVFEDGTTETPYEGSEWVLVAELPASTTSFNDNIETSCTGAPLTTEDPSLFPAPEGICHVARTEDGIVVADYNNLYISYSGTALFTWDGIVSIDDKILAVEAIGNTIFVITDNYPVQVKYRIGDGLLIIDRQTIRRRLPLKSHKSVSVYGNTVYFSSEYSLMAWDIQGYGSDIKDAIRSLISPEQWRNIKPESVRGTAYEYGYILSASGIPYALMLEFEGGGIDTINKTSVMPITYAKAELYTTDKDGHIIFKQGKYIYRWDWRRNICDNIFDLYKNNRQDYCSQCCPWTIELYYDNEGKNRFDVMRVEFDEETTTKGIEVEFFRSHFNRSKESDGKFTVTSSRGFRIRGYRSSQTVSAKLTSCAIMHEVRFATSFQELVSSGGDQNEF